MARTDPSPELLRLAQRLVQLLGTGSLEEAAVTLAGHRPADAAEQLLVEVAHMDLRARDLAVDPGELILLHDEHRRAAEALGRPELHWWATAALTDRLLAEGSLEAVAIAIKTLNDVPQHQLIPTFVRYARGRLRRAAGAAYLDHRGTRVSVTHQAHRDDAVGDFARAGFDVEAALTRLSTAATQPVVSQEQPVAYLKRALAVRAQVPPEPALLWSAAIDQLVGVVAFSAGDLDTAHQAYDRLALAPRGGYYHALAEYGRALAAMVAAGGSDAAVDRAAAAVDRLAELTPPTRRICRQLMVNILADLGRPAAQRFEPLPDDALPYEFARMEDALVQTRIDLTNDKAPPDGEAESLIAGFADTGLRRQAGQYAVRIAHDLTRAGYPHRAQAMHALGLHMLPEPSRCTLWELVWCRPLDTPAPAAPPELRVLQPVVSLQMGGRWVELQDRVAHLVLLLVLSHPAPLHAERVTDLLWPDASVDVGRSRLKALVHRVRRTLAPASAIGRDRHRLWFEPGGLDVDLLRYREAVAAGNTGGVRAVLASVRGNLAHQQVTDDEFLSEHRAVLRGEMLAQIDDLVKVDPSASPDLRAAAESLAMDEALRPSVPG